MTTSSKKTGHKAENALFALGIIVLVAVLAIPPKWVVNVRHLSYDSRSGSMTQDRELLFSAKMRWQAAIYERRGSSWVSICEGSGSWRYSAGRKVVSIPIDRWVGDDGCEARMTVGKEYVANGWWSVFDNVPIWTDEAESAPFTYLGREDQEVTQ